MKTVLYNYQCPTFAHSLSSYTHFALLIHRYYRHWFQMEPIKHHLSKRIHREYTSILKAKKLKASSP